MKQICILVILHCLFFCINRYGVTNPAFVIDFLASRLPSLPPISLFPSLRLVAGVVESLLQIFRKTCCSVRSLLTVADATAKMMQERMMQGQRFLRTIVMSFDIHCFRFSPRYSNGVMMCAFVGMCLCKWTYSSVGNDVEFGYGDVMFDSYTVFTWMATNSNPTSLIIPWNCFRLPIRIF